MELEGRFASYEPAHEFQDTKIKGMKNNLRPSQRCIRIYARILILPEQMD